MKSLVQLYNEDINDRKEVEYKAPSQEELKKLNQRDQSRRQIVMKLYKDKKIHSAKDFHYAALIFQHGETSDEYRLAHEFATKAVEQGDRTARWLSAATLDRYLLSSGKPQKFGTQFIKDGKGDWHLAQPVDPSVTDEERSLYGVPPLKDALKQFQEKYKKF